MNWRSSTLYLALVVFLASANAFAPPLKVSSTTTKLHLTPEQGSQLVAAWNAACSHKDDDGNYHYEEIHHHQEEKSMNMKSARGFVSRVFSIPSSMIRRHPHPKEEGFDHPHPKEEGFDVVYYPIVGFQFVQGHSRVFPTTAYATACHLPSTLPVYGWFTPCEDPSLRP
jgi:hypothetical protein